MTEGDALSAQEGCSIHILDANTINQIAAGEVVERPASVVKELVENSIDAKATKVRIEVKEGGKRLILIEDNGRGMTKEEVGLSVLKHSTSKISKITDLDSLSTLGFRGEALASIAAVSRLSLSSKTDPTKREALGDVTETGFRLVIDGGNTIEESEVGCATGTTVKVSDLFFNIPARKKYLKSDATELAHITDVVTKMALAYPQVHFILVHEANELINTPPTDDKLENIALLFGKDLARDLLWVQDIGNDLKISGYISRPSLNRSTAGHQYLFVNGRCVSNKAISAAVKDAYKTMLMKHRYPLFFLDLELHPSQLDINVSPTKAEVRFVKENFICTNLTSVVKSTLKEYDLSPDLGKTDTMQVDLKGSEKREEEQKALRSLLLGDSPASNDEEHTSAAQTGGIQSSFSLNGGAAQSIEHEVISKDFEMQLDSPPEHGDHLDLSEGQEVAVHPTLPKMTPLAQVHNLYIVAQTKDGMVIIDQHAAHERVMLEQIQEQYKNVSEASQELLTPISMDLAPREFTLLESYLNTLKDLCFNIEPFGKNTVKIRAVPVFLNKLERKEAIYDVIDDLLTRGKIRDEDKLRDKVIEIMACRCAVKAGAKLSIGEMDRILTQLTKVENPYHCAHGRPTILRLTSAELLKRFKRTGA